MAQAVMERPDVATDVEDRNLRTARRALLLGWSGLNPAENCPEAAEIFAPGFRTLGPARDAFGALAPRQRGSRLNDGFSEIDVRIERMVAQGPTKVVSFLRFRGRHTSPFQGHEPSGREMTADGYVVHRFDGQGRITEEWTLLRWS